MLVYQRVNGPDGFAQKYPKIPKIQSFKTLFLSHLQVAILNKIPDFPTKATCCWFYHVTSSYEWYPVVAPKIVD